jgi:hypothetical protein
MSSSQSQENNILNIDLSDDNETQTERNWKKCDHFMINGIKLLNASFEEIFENILNLEKD